MSVEFHILHTLIPVGCWWGHSTIHSSKRSRRARLNLPRGESPSLLMQVAPLPVRCERMRNGNNKPSSWSKSSCIVTSFWCLHFQRSKIMSDSVILCDRSAYHFEKECSIIRKSQVWGTLEQTKRTPTAMQQSCARMGSNLEGVSMKGQCSAAKASSVKANLLSQGTYAPSSLCPTTPLKKLRFQTTKTSKIVHKHFICSFKRRSFSGFGEKSLLLGIHRSWSCPALGALTQASTVIVAPPKEDLLEFFQICRLV